MITITEEIKKDIQAAIGPDYDVIVESNHIHLEFDPK